MQTEYQRHIAELTAPTAVGSGDLLGIAIKNMKNQLTELAQRWRRDADQYQRQVEEARAKYLPHDQMLSMMTCLRSCDRDLENSVAAMLNDQDHPRRD